MTFNPNTQPKRAYLAAPYVARDWVRAQASALDSVGWVSSSSWAYETHEISAGTIDTAPQRSAEQVRKHVDMDLEDVARSHALVLFTENYLRKHIETDLPMTSGGRHIETGYAMCLGLDIVVVGEPENIFHRGGAYTQIVEDWDEALWLLSTLGKGVE